MPLTANRELGRYTDQEIRLLPVKGGVRIYKGALLGLSGGFVRPLVGGDSFAGVAYEEANNASGTDGAVSVRVFTQGDFDHPLASASRASNGTQLFASDDGTLTTASAGNSLVGRQVDVSGTGRVVIRIRTVFA